MTKVRLVRSPRKEDDILIAPSLYSLSNKMDNYLLDVRDICEISEDVISSTPKNIELKRIDIEKIRNIPKGNISNLLLVYDYLLKHPFLETEDIRFLSDLSKPTINKLLETLIELEILELVEEKKRYKQYVYKKYVDILSEGAIL